MSNLKQRKMRVKIRSHCDPKPIPSRNFDWTAVTDDYEPGDSIGYGASEQEAITDLKDQLGDEE